MVRIAVLGAGVIGLCSAVQIQDVVPAANVTVIADAWDSETTSAGAGGLFRMTEEHAPGNDIKLFRKWSKDAWDFWHAASLSSEGPEMGIIPVILHNVSRKPTAPQLFSSVCYSYHEMTPEQARAFGPEYNHGYMASTVVTDCAQFNTWLKNRFVTRGGRCVKRKVHHLSEIPASDYDVIINCTGLGSRWLFNDEKVYPVRGETVRVHAPWIKSCYFAESGENTYIITLPNCLVIGGTRQKNDYDLSLRPNEDKEMLERAIKLYPPLKGAKVLKRWVGLRPYREPIRVELEEINVGGRKVKVVHHYGHGGFGVCLSWGTAIHATRLVREALGLQPPNSTPPAKL